VRHIIVSNENDCGPAQRDPVPVRHFVLLPISHADKKRDSLVHCRLDLVLCHTFSSLLEYPKARKRRFRPSPNN
jgi:hypothetical protein